MRDDTTGRGQAEPREGETEVVRFFLEELEEAERLVAGPQCPDRAESRLATVRAELREAERVEWEERRRLARAPVDGLTAAHAALLEARQAHSRAAATQIEDLRRRAVWLRQAIATGEEAIAAQRRVVDRLRRELAEIGD